MKRAGLSRRLPLAMTGIALGSMLVLSVGVWAGHQIIEERVLNVALDHELDFALDHAIDPRDFSRKSLRYYRPARYAAWPAPPALARLGPGHFHDVEVDDRRYHVIVRELAAGDRAYFAFDIESLEHRESYAFATVGAVLLATLLLAFLASRRIAALSLQPLDLLVQRIRALDPERRGERIRFHGGEPDLLPVVTRFNAHIAALDEVVEREKVFAAAASHELRTPLAVIASAAELHAAHPQEAGDACERILGAVKTATHLLDGLLTLWRAPQPGQPMDLGAVLQELAAEFETDVRRHRGQLHWHLEAPAQWRGSRGVAAIIFGNILRNALQTRPDAAIDVTISATEVSVRDFGAGLDPAVVAHAFEPGVSGRTGGTGVGLYVARAIARRHGGDVRLEAPIGGGVRAVWRFGDELPH